MCTVCVRRSYKGLGSRHFPSDGCIERFYPAKIQLFYLPARGVESFYAQKDYDQWPDHDAQDGHGQWSMVMVISFLSAFLAHEVGAAEDGQHGDAGAKRSVLVASLTMVR